MPRIPGITNGGVPRNIVWDENNPPVMNLCSDLIGIHAPNCDGHCEKKVMTKLEVDLTNEYREWARAGMSTANISRDLFKIGNQLVAIINLLKGLIEDGDVALNEEYQRVCLEELKAIREQVGESVQRARLGLAPSPLLGPDGRPLQ